MRPSKRNKQEQSKRRFEAIKDLMSTFAMSTVAVVAVVTLIPASPKAEITKAVALREEIVYQVKVTDAENALDLSTLFVVLENQFDSYEQPIHLGENAGFFEGLDDDTEYRLSVYGNKGFGQERLDTVKLTTEEKLGGTILAVEKEQADYLTTYHVDLSINDPDQAFQAVTFYYGYQMGHGEEELFYQSIPVTMDRMSLEVSNIYTDHPIHMYLEGSNEDGVQVLDEIYVEPPFSYYASVYLQSFGDEEMEFSLYTEGHIEDQSFEMRIYQKDQLFRTDLVELKEGGYEGSSFSITNLSPNTTYYFECVASFTNPRTLRREEQIIYQEEWTTLEEYHYSYELLETEESFTFTLVLEDPSDYFQTLYVEIYDQSEEFPMYLFGETYGFETFGQEKRITISINKPMVLSYKLVIGMQNQLDYTINQRIHEETFVEEEANE